MIAVVIWGLVVWAVLSVLAVVFGILHQRRKAVDAGYAARWS
jgi:choline-glycine betaine transporter